jgi:hypothetical protein
MTDTLTGAELAATIEKIVTVLPENHDQGYWFYSYEAGDNYAPVDPSTIELVQIKDAALAGKLDEMEVKCNTTFCTAGWACILNGYKLMQSTDQHGYRNDVAVGADGFEHNIADLAASLLDIDDEVAEVLFDGDTSNDDAAEILFALGEGDMTRVEELVETVESRCSCCSEDDDYDY